jgi:hypothetical protein
LGSIALLLLAAGAAAADSPAATSLVARVGTRDRSPSEFELQTSVGVTRFGGSLRGDVLAALLRLGEPLGESAVGIAVAVPVTRGLSVEGLAIARAASGEAGAHQDLAGARLIDAGSRGCLWAGYARAISARSGATDGPLFQTGGDVAIGRLSVSGSLARSTTTWHVTIPGSTTYAGDTIVPPVIPAREETRRGAGSTVRLGSTWSATRWSVGTMGGMRWESALPTARWLRVEGAWWLRPRLALSLGLGREVADPWEVGSARRGTSLALEWTGPHWETPASAATVPRAVALRVVNVGGDLRRIEVTAPGARRIEAMGDFTMWEAVELPRSSRGRFRLELHLAPGVYRVQVRRDDGPWMIPANLPGMDDPDLGGAGTLVIE